MTTIHGILSHRPPAKIWSVYFPVNGLYSTGTRVIFIPDDSETSSPSQRKVGYGCSVSSRWFSRNFWKASTQACLNGSSTCVSFLILSYPEKLLEFFLFLVDFPYFSWIWRPLCLCREYCLSTILHVMYIFWFRGESFCLQVVELKRWEYILWVVLKWVFRNFDVEIYF